jgi:hypothetical protein
LLIDCSTKRNILFIGGQTLKVGSFQVGNQFIRLHLLLHDKISISWWRKQAKKHTQQYRRGQRAIKLADFLAFIDDRTDV